MYIFEYEEHLKQQFRKHPRLQQDFERLVCLYLIGDFLHFDQVKELKEDPYDDFYDDFYTKKISIIDKTYFDGIFNKYIEHRLLFKNINLNFQGFPGKYGDSHQWENFEDFDDHMTFQIEQSRIIKYQNSILRENKHLADDLSLFKFKALYDLGIKKDIVSDHLKKINAWTESEQLNDALDKVINNLNQKDLAYYVNELKNTNSNILYSEDDLLIFEVFNYETSKKFGSAQWCISYEETYWDKYLYSDYTGEEHPLKETSNHTFFVFDFKKDIDDPLSKIAFTTLPNSLIIFAFDNNDHDILNLMGNSNLDNRINTIKNCLGNYFNKDDDQYISLDHINFEERSQFIDINITNPISYISKYLKSSFFDDLEENKYFLSYDVGTTVEETYREFNNIIDGFSRSSLGINLIEKGEIDVINNLLYLKNEFGTNLDFSFLKSLKKIDISEFQEYFENNIEQLLHPMKETYKNDKIDDCITENFIFNSFNWKIDNDKQQDLFKIFIHKDWSGSSDDFINIHFESGYQFLNLASKIDILKHIQNIPTDNATLFLSKLNEDPSFSLKNNEFTFQDLFVMAESDIFYNLNEIYPNIASQINNNIIKSSQHFKGNGLVLSNKIKKPKFSDNKSAFFKLYHIIKSDIIEKDDLKDWLSDLKKSTFEFSHEDFLLSKTLDHENHEDVFSFFDNLYFPKDKKKSNKPRIS